MRTTRCILARGPSSTGQTGSLPTTRVAAFKHLEPAAPQIFGTKFRAKQAHRGPEARPGHVPGPRPGASSDAKRAAMRKRSPVRPGQAAPTTRDPTRRSVHRVRHPFAHPYSPADHALDETRTHGDDARDRSGRELVRDGSGGFPDGAADIAQGKELMPRSGRSLPLFVRSASFPGHAQGRWTVPSAPPR